MAVALAAWWLVVGVVLGQAAPAAPDTDQPIVINEVTIESATLVAATMPAAGAEPGVEPPAATQPMEPVATQPVEAAATTSTAPAIATAPTDALSIERLKTRITDLQASGTDPAVVSAAVQAYSEAIDALTAQQQYERQAGEFSGSITPSREAVEQIRAELQSVSTQPATATTTAPHLPAADLERERLARETERADVERQLADLDAQMQAESARPAAIQVRMGEIRDRIQQLEAEARAPATGEAADVADAKAALRSARLLARRAELQALEQELLSFEARNDLRRARRDLAGVRASRLQTVTKNLRDAVDRAREAERERAAREAAEAAERAAAEHPLVKAAAERNALLAQQATELAQQISKTTADSTAINTQLERVEDRFENVRQRVEQVGSTSAVGALLRRELEVLPSVREVRTASALRQDQIAQARLQSLDVDQARANLADVEATVQDMLATVEGQLTAEQRARLETNLRALLNKRRELASQLSADYTQYLLALAGLDYAERQLLQQTEDYASFIRERILWVRSTETISLRMFDLAARGLWRLTLGAPWHQVPTAAWDSFKRDPLSTIVLGLSSIVLLALRPWLRRSIDAIADLVNDMKRDRFSLTVRAVLFTAAMAAGLPLLFGTVGLLLTHALNPPFVQALGGGLIRVAVLLIGLEFLRFMARPDGLAEAHFDWPKQRLTVVRRAMAWLVFITLPLCLLGGMADGYMLDAQDAQTRDAVGVLLMIVSKVALSGVLAYAVSPKFGLFASELSKAGLARRTRWVWYPLLILAPASLAVLACIGFYHTARELQDVMLASFYVIAAVIILHALFSRLVFVIYRNITMAAYRKQREAAAQPKVVAGAPEEAQSVPVVTEEPGTDLAQIDTQTRGLLRAGALITLGVGLLWVWADVLPALRILSDIVVWTSNQQIEETVVNADGANVTRETIVAMPTTLADLLLSIGLFALTIIGARNLPGLLEIAVLRQLSVEAGTRYAVTTISRYVIIGVGVALSLGTLGVGWDRLQWLVAAVSVGLGFGLQEIFANFVSGLILLLERPVSVGDTVTIGGRTGVVSRIRIRATTIIDWDRKELIVPNKEFITATLVNWTSDPVIRIVVPVSVKLGVDAADVQKALMEVATQNSRVLNEPAPTAVFVSFRTEPFMQGAMLFELRAFVSTADQVKALHELGSAIEHTLRERGIQIV